MSAPGAHSSKYGNQTDDNTERYKAKWYYLLKGIINVMIKGNSFYDQPRDCDIKRKKVGNMTR